MTLTEVLQGIQDLQETKRDGAVNSAEFKQLVNLTKWLTTHVRAQEVEIRKLKIRLEDTRHIAEGADAAANSAHDDITSIQSEMTGMQNAMGDV